MNSIVSQRGYSISKQGTADALLEHHRQRLTVVPHVERKEYAHLAKPIKIYQETDKRLYMPRFYGLNEIGPADTDKMWSKESEQCPRLKFNGKLRANQLDVHQVTLKSLRKRGGGVISVACGQGKCLSRDTPVLMFDGTIKKVQDVEVGDLLMGDDSTPRRIMSLARGKEMMYDIVPTKGDTYTVNESHILSLKCSTNGKYGKKGAVVDMALTDYLALPASYHGRAGPLLGYRVGVDWVEANVPLDPYFLGIWLGDGHSYTATAKFTPMDKEILSYRILNKVNTGDDKANAFTDILRNLQVLKNKHIPHIYKCNTRDVRMAVLAGILDADGSLTHNGYDIIEKRKRLAEDITFLARSLGFAAYMKECQKTCTHAVGGPKKETYYLVNIHGSRLEELPLLLERKKTSPRRQIKDPLVTRIKVVKKGEDDYYGFTINGNHRFLLGDFTVTHNTVLALHLACELGIPVGVVCHTTAMMKQWHERIQQFVPTARVGIVQRTKCQIEDKDIVIMSVKTVAKRNYGKHAFERLGLMIWDEIHLMCTDLFSKAFPKLATKYTLGLSATPYRKDRCDVIFQTFIGPVVYMRKRGKDHTIEARCISLLMDDIDVKLNRHHKIMYTPTTVACVNRSERTEYLAKHAIGPLAEEGRTILVLGEYVNHLKALKKALDALKLIREDVRPVTVGLYIGEMKNEQRKESEGKDIILGTYKLASVGMDIQSLNTLVFASPRKDIEQSVGRILRKSHASYPPLIIDIIDNHSLYRAQSTVRKKFYRTYGYSIVHMRVEIDGTVKSTRRTKPKIESICIDTPPSSDESGGESPNEKECLFEL